MICAYCPECGAKVDDVVEAHRVGSSDARPIRKPLVWPAGRVVLWPCGHDLPSKAYRLLT